jgi:hypothetical protein
VIRLRLTRIRIALLERFGDFFSDRTSPSAVRVLPCEAVMFARRANDSLRLLGHLRIIVLFLGILVLCLDETATNLNGAQLVGTDTSV